MYKKATKPTKPTKATKAKATKPTKPTKAKINKKYNIKRILGGDDEIWSDEHIPTNEEIRLYQEKKKIRG